MDENKNDKLENEKLEEELDRLVADKETDYGELDDFLTDSDTDEFNSLDELYDEDDDSFVTEEPEVAKKSKKSSGKGSPIVKGAAALVLIGGVAAGGAYVWMNKDTLPIVSDYLGSSVRPQPRGMAGQNTNPASNQEPLVFSAMPRQNPVPSQETSGMDDGFGEMFNEFDAPEGDDPFANIPQPSAMGNEGDVSIDDMPAQTTASEGDGFDNLDQMAEVDDLPEFDTGNFEVPEDEPAQDLDMASSDSDNSEGAIDGSFNLGESMDTSSSDVAEPAPQAVASASETPEEAPSEAPVDTPTVGSNTTEAISATISSGRADEEKPEKTTVYADNGGFFVSDGTNVTRVQETESPYGTTVNVPVGREKRGSVSSAGSSYEVADNIDFSNARQFEPKTKLQTMSDRAYRLGRYESALTLYEQAIRERPQDAFVWKGHALTLLALGREVEAKQSFQKLMTVVSKDGASVAGMMDVIRLFDPHQALDYLIEVNRASPGNDKVLAEIGITLSEMGDQERAMGYLENAIAINPNNPLYLFNIAVSYDRAEQTNEAVYYYQKALEADAAYHNAEKLDRAAIYDRMASLR